MYVTVGHDDTRSIVTEVKLEQLASPLQRHTILDLNLRIIFNYIDLFIHMYNRVWCVYVYI